MIVNWSDIRNRLKSLRTEEGLSQDQFAAIAGITRSSYGQIELGKHNIGIEGLAAISDHFNKPIEWLLFGIDSSSVAKEPPSVYVRNSIKPFPVTVDASGKERITLVDVKAAAGYPHLHSEVSFFKNLPTFTLPGYEFQQATFRCFEVQGDSMQRTIYHGDWIIAQYVDDFIDNIRDGMVYVLVTKTDVFVKRLLNRVKQRGKVVLQSDNKSYPTVEIPAEDVQEVWIAKRKLSALFINPDHNLQEQVNSLVADMIEIKSRIAEIEVQKRPH